MIDCHLARGTAARKRGHMDEREILLAQATSLHRNLCRVVDLLAAFRKESRLLARVSERIDRLLQRQRVLAEETLKKVRRGDSLPECWDAFRGIKRQSEHAFAECLAFLQGALVRSAGIDNGICRLADAMLSNLSERAGIRWERFTILASSEFFVNIAEIIRLRFPENTIWHLPVAAHEFGHFVAHDLMRQDIFGDSFRKLLKREEAKGEPHVRFLHEFFADVFATYTTGPAYPCTCIALRFDPGTSQQDSRTHPSDARRVHLLLRTLRAMDEISGSAIRPYHETVNELARLWERNLRENMQFTEIYPEAKAELDATFEELFKVMVAELREEARYGGWLRAQALASQWRVETADVPEPGESDNLIDVVNAAWLWRLYNHGADELALGRVGEKALKVCEKIVARDEAA